MKLVWFVATTWIWWSLMARWPAHAAPPKVTFTTDGATSQTYATFLNQLRRNLRGTRVDRNNIPVLPAAEEMLNTDQRFVLAEIKNRAGSTVTLVLNRLDVYFIGFRALVAGRQPFFFSDFMNPQTAPIFPNTRPISLGYTGRYPDLEGRARESNRLRAESRDRSNIPLGVDQLDAAIGALFGLAAAAPNDHVLPVRFITIAQMVSEAARFGGMEIAVQRGIEARGSVYPSAYLRSLQNNWQKIGRAIQIDDKEGPLKQPLVLAHPNSGDRWDVTTYRELSFTASNVALLLASSTCRRRQGGAEIELEINRHDRQPPQGRLLSDDDPCKDVLLEPTVHIVGVDRLCLEVSNGKIVDGSPLGLDACSPKAAKQLWASKRDGTLRMANDQLCLTASMPDKSVKLRNCKSMATAAIAWEIWKSGSIVNAQNNVALTAGSYPNYKLDLQRHDLYYPGQAWTLSQDVEQPYIVAPILGLRDLYLRAFDQGRVWVARCECDMPSQLWALFPDSTIRPHLDHMNCIGFDDSDRLAKAQECKADSHQQRWEFRNDGAIANLKTGNVMTVENSDPGRHRIVVSKHIVGSLNQQWMPLM